MHQERRDERRKAAKDRDGDVVADRQGRVAHSRREELGVEGRAGAGVRRVEDDHQELREDRHPDAAGRGHQEKGIAEHDIGGAGEQQQRAPAHPVRQPAHQRQERNKHHETARADPQHGALRQLRDIDHVAVHKDQRDVVGDRVVQRRAEAEECLPGMVAEGFGQGRLGDRALLLDLGEFRRVVEAPAQIPPDDSDRDPEEERHAPAPGKPVGIRQGADKQGGGQRAEQKPARDADQLEGTEKAAPARRREFDDIGGRAAELATDREPLEQPHDDEERGCDDAGLGISRQQPHRKGRDRHDKDDGAERLAPAMLVAIDAEQDRPDRPHDKTDPEYRKGRQQRDQRIAAREEQGRDRRHEIAVDAEIVPFEDIADDAGSDRLAVFGAAGRDRGCCCRHAVPPHFLPSGLPAPPALLDHSATPARHHSLSESQNLWSGMRWRGFTSRRRIRAH